MALMTMSGVTFAGYANDCIDIGTEMYKGKVWSANITNNCTSKINVIFCHDSSDSSFKDSRCGDESKYYQKQVVIEPGKSYSNKYSLPDNAKINYGSCFGGYESTPIVTSGSSYKCP